jgi:hypothetical protein
VFVIVIVLVSAKTTTAPRTQNKRSAARSADHVGVHALWRWREEKTFSSTHVLPFNNRSTYDGQIILQIWKGFELALL